MLLMTVSQASMGACETDPAQIFGFWHFEDYIYQGQRQPRPNPKLHIYFEINDTGTHRISWKRDNESGFCEKFSIYTYQDCQFSDEVVWVNPNNSPECQKDPDMRLGRKTTTEMNLVNGELFLHMSLAGEPFIYIFQKQKSSNSVAFQVAPDSL